MHNRKEFSVCGNWEQNTEFREIVLGSPLCTTSISCSWELFSAVSLFITKLRSKLNDRSIDFVFFEKILGE